MRAFLTSLLALLVAFQSTWTLAAPYCQHERAIGTAHFGHHLHEHEDVTPYAATGADDPAESIDPSAPGADADCSACHATNPAIVFPVAQVLPELDGSGLLDRIHWAFSAGPPARIERPNWRTLV